MKIETKQEPAGYRPITATITFETAREAAIFRCIAGNPGAFAQRIAHSLAACGAGTFTYDEIIKSLSKLTEAVPSAVYYEASRG